MVHFFRTQPQCTIVGEKINVMPTSRPWARCLALLLHRPGSGDDVGGYLALGRTVRGFWHPVTFPTAGILDCAFCSDLTINWWMRGLWTESPLSAVGTLICYENLFYTIGGSTGGRLVGMWPACAIPKGAVRYINNSDSPGP